MSDLYNRIEELCRIKGVTITKMCADSGASRASLTDLKKGRKNSLSSKTLSLIGAYFGISIDALLGNIEEAGDSILALQALRDEDRALLDVVRGMTPDQVKSMTEFARKMKGE